MIKYLQLNSILIDRYQIIDYLSRGSMGAVYSGFDVRLKCKVAIKQNLLDTNEKTIILFKREAELLANLKHSGLPKVTDYFFVIDTYYLVMELVEGEDLKKMLERGECFTYEQGLFFFEKLLDILSYLHSHYIFHTDIKPSNLKIDQDLNLKLLDFGLAKGRIGEISEDTNLIGGTPLYMSLEQHDYSGSGNYSISERSDIYSASATFYHVITGVEAIPVLERYNIFKKENIDPLRKISELKSEFPTSISDLFHKGMELVPENRIQYASEFKQLILEKKGEKYKKYNKWPSIKKNNFFTNSSIIPDKDGIFPMSVTAESRDSEMVILLKDNSPFIYQLKNLNPFVLYLKSGLYNTSFGYIVFALFYFLDPLDSKKLFAGYENYINVYNPTLLNDFFQLARQSHWHVYLINSEKEIIDVFEFENVYDLENTLNRVIKLTRDCPHGDFMKAKKEFMETFTIEDLFQN